jgi:divalent metal cation (Fe/Co/Zn/Cd) transporter
VNPQQDTPALPQLFQNGSICLFCCCIRPLGIAHVASQTGRTVVIAFVAGLAVALAKIVAAIVTASPALSAEAAHSLGDSANDLFLIVAQVRSRRPADEQNPLGHGREAYF